MSTDGEIVAEDWLHRAVDTCVRLAEAAGVVVIAVGVLLAFVGFLRALPRRDARAFVPVRLSLGRYLVLGLEFQLASDLLRTAVAPSFDELGKLAAVATIRTALNVVLEREMRQEKASLDADAEPDRTDRDG